MVALNSRLLPIAALVCAVLAISGARSEELPLTPNLPMDQFQNRQEDVKPYDFDAPPEGLFRAIVLAQGFEEELAFRRTHEIVPDHPTDIFSPDASVYVVFHVHQHYEPYQVFGVVFPEEVEGLDPQAEITQDAMLLALEDESGYVRLDPPAGGWRPGRYKINIHVGWQINDLTHLGVMRFQIRTPVVGEEAKDHHAAAAGKRR